MRRPVAVMLMTGGLTVGASLPAETAPGAAGLRVGDRLTWTQPDGTPLAFRPELRVWCGPWASDVPVPSIHVRVGSRTRAGLSHWELHAVLADVRRRPLVRPAAAGRLPDRRASRQRALRRRAGQRPRLLLRVDVGAVMRSRVCTHDEYLIAAEHKSQVKWNGDTGSIQITDLPSASAYFEEMHFETAIVGVDVDGKGTDKILKNDYPDYKYT